MTAPPAVAAPVFEANLWRLGLATFLTNGSAALDVGRLIGIELFINSWLPCLLIYLISCLTSDFLFLMWLLRTFEPFVVVAEAILFVWLSRADLVA